MEPSSFAKAIKPFLDADEHYQEYCTKGNNCKKGSHEYWRYHQLRSERYSACLKRMKQFHLSKKLVKQTCDTCVFYDFYSVPWGCVHPNPIFMSTVKYNEETVCICWKSKKKELS